MPYEYCSRTGEQKSFEKLGSSRIFKHSNGMSAAMFAQTATFCNCKPNCSEPLFVRSNFNTFSSDLEVLIRLLRPELKNGRYLADLRHMPFRLKIGAQ